MSNGWTPASPCAPPTLYLPLSGGAMTGPLILAADPVQPLEAATKQYVDESPLSSDGRLGDNRIINGDMRIDQRNNGASGTANAYTVDRWVYSASQPSKGTWGRWNGASLPAFQYALNFQSSSAYAVLAGDYFRFQQQIEADMIGDFAWGTASAQPVTLSFWVNATIAGTYGGTISNFAGTRSYPFSYSVPVASTWARIVITVPGDTSGAWILSGNAAALTLNIGLGAGATFSGPAGAWASANYNNTIGAVSVVAINGATFFVTGVKLEIGTVATPFNRQSLAKSMADCQRYYQGPGLIESVGYSTTGATVGVGRSNPVVMRAAPTLIITDTSGCNNITTPTSVNAFGPGDVFGLGNVVATGTYTLNYKFNASAGALTH